MKASTLLAWLYAFSLSQGRLLALGKSDNAKEKESHGKNALTVDKQALHRPRHAVVSGIQQAGRDIKASTCPIVGNRSTRVYYSPSNKEYPKVLAGKKAYATDKRECFHDETAALESGYEKAQKR